MQLVLIINAVKDQVLIYISPRETKNNEGQNKYWVIHMNGLHDDFGRRAIKYMSLDRLGKYSSYSLSAAQNKTFDNLHDWHGVKHCTEYKNGKEVCGECKTKNTLFVITFMNKPVFCLFKSLFPDRGRGAASSQQEGITRNIWDLIGCDGTNRFRALFWFIITQAKINKKGFVGLTFTSR